MILSFLQNSNCTQTKTSIHFCGLLGFETILFVFKAEKKIKNEIKQRKTVQK